MLRGSSFAREPAGAASASNTGIMSKKSEKQKSRNSDTKCHTQISSSSSVSMERLALWINSLTFFARMAFVGFEKRLGGFGCFCPFFLSFLGFCSLGGAGASAGGAGAAAAGFTTAGTLVPAFCAASYCSTHRLSAPGLGGLFVERG